MVTVVLSEIKGASLHALVPRHPGLLQVQAGINCDVEEVQQRLSHELTHS